MNFDFMTCSNNTHCGPRVEVGDARQKHQLLWVEPEKSISQRLLKVLLCESGLT